MVTRKPFPATLLCDFYKTAHREQYPVGTEYVYSTWTPRTSRVPGIYDVVAFGFQGFIKEFLIDYFTTNFFNRPKADVVAEYKRVIRHTLGAADPEAGHIEALHDLGYLPIRIKAVPEGTRVPLRVPMMTIENTDPRFFWLTNYLETLASCSLWLPTTSATLAFEYKRILTHYAQATGGDLNFVPFQGHDFSMRGMGCLEAAAKSGGGHLLSFLGTDTIPAIGYLENYYNANIEEELVGTSIPATEHSVMCAHGRDELAVFKDIITRVYPSGFASIVSDTWDLWQVFDTVIRPLADTIKARPGKVVIRPDSGDPVKIICGEENHPNPLARKGALEVLWDIFGGTINDAGFKVLHPSIGLIYGDAITLERCTQICEKLRRKGFASTNVVYGIGSYTYQYVTRDTFGFALKSTHVVIDGKEKNIFKNPATDVDSIKKSQFGRVAVLKTQGKIHFVDNLSKTDVVDLDLLQTIYEDGKLIKETSLGDIRGLLASQL